ncbi:hypothetical protein [Hyphomonas sp.]|uniref:hypothetical protein n=1 Tax=Hyphomonas sp. TaxID=87 RepID=UPI0025BE0BFD|nr:hypothetical protein [Hyphomonas sp.]|tara:strand:- start:184 stop:417 length:234 start_codon:yes stop_codon:yes gene_type:complete
MSNDAAAGTMMIVFGVVYLAIIVLFIVGYWKIWSKAGFNGAWSLLMLVPLVNLIAFLYLAFADWPIHKRLRDPDTFN